MAASGWRLMLRALDHVPHVSAWELAGQSGRVSVTLEDGAGHACLSLCDRHCTAQVALTAQGLLELASALVDAAERLQATHVPPAG